MGFWTQACKLSGQINVFSHEMSKFSSFLLSILSLSFAVLLLDYFSLILFVPGNSLSLWPRHMQWAKSSAERDDRGES